MGEVERHGNSVGFYQSRRWVANMIEKGKTPVLSRPELERLGFGLILYAYLSCKRIQRPSSLQQL